MARMRLDKLLASSGFGTRNEVRDLLKKKRVTVDGEFVKNQGLNIDTEVNKVTVDDRVVEWREFYYLMLNKPDGVISATKDRLHQTVVDLIPEEYAHVELFPVGRLDKDSEGLLLMTNDGQLAHRLLSPKRHVPKVYYVTVEGEITQGDVKRFNTGIDLEDFTTLPAELKILEAGDESKAEVTIHEGKFHQVKRMFEAVGKRVTYLKRLSMGPLQLDESLFPGDIRELTDEEVQALKDVQESKND